MLSIMNEINPCLSLPLCVLYKIQNQIFLQRPKQTSLRTSLDEAFIRNAKSFCQTSLTLTYPLSFTVEVRSHCVTFWSLVHPCLSRSSTLTCMDLIIQYLFCYSRSRYAHCGHTGYCIICAPCPEGRAS